MPIETYRWAIRAIRSFAARAAALSLARPLVQEAREVREDRSDLLKTNLNLF